MKARQDVLSTTVSVYNRNSLRIKRSDNEHTDEAKERRRNMIKQINIFVENKPGKLKAIAELLWQKEIDIKALTIQDRKDYGMLKLLVDNPEKAHLVLQDSGFASALKDIVAVYIDDRPGGLHALAAAMEKHSINILDAYSYTIESHKRAVWCSEVSDVHAADQALASEAFTSLTEDDLAAI